MTCTANKSPRKDDLEDELEKIVYKVIQKRKLYPKKCSQLLSKKLKMEHYILENTKIVLEGSAEKEVSKDDCVSEDIAEITCEPLIESSVIMDKIATLGKEADNILAVFEQLKSENDSEIVKLCTRELQSSNSNGELT